MSPLCLWLKEKLCEAILELNPKNLKQDGIHKPSFANNLFKEDSNKSVLLRNLKII